MTFGTISLTLLQPRDILHTIMLICWAKISTLVWIIKFYWRSCLTCPNNSDANTASKSLRLALDSSVNMDVSDEPLMPRSRKCIFESTWLGSCFCCVPIEQRFCLSNVTWILGGTEHIGCRENFKSIWPTVHCFGKISSNICSSQLVLKHSI